MNHNPVIVSGGGPVGLVAALALAEKGVNVVVLEACAEIPTDLRAGTFHPPTVEMLDTLSIGQELLKLGIKVSEWQVRDRKQGLIAQFDLGMIAGETSYPFRLHCEQHKLSRLAYQALQRFPNARVLFGHECVSFTQDEECVTVQVTSDGVTRNMQASYLIGADGVRSIVRKTANIEFEGFTWPERFLVFATTFDLKSCGFTGNAYIADPDEWAAIFVQPHNGPPGIYRIAFPIQPDQTDEEVLSDDYVQSRIQGFLLPDQTYDIPYRSVYRVHQRVAKSFRSGRILLAGDAAHVNNPLGGMGLNSGIHDAMNLAEKLTRVLLNNESTTLLDLYDRQRRLTNIEYVQAITIRNKKMLEERDPEIRAQRSQEMRDIASDPEKHRAFLMNSSMINSVRRAAQIE